MSTGPREILRMLRVAGLGVAMTAAISLSVAHRERSEPPPRPCLAGVAPPDLDAPPGFASRWARLGPADCAAGSWLSHFDERGQTFGQYVAEVPNRPVEAAPLRLLPLGALDVRGDAARALIPTIGEFLSIYFQRDVELGDSVPLPPSTFRPHRGLRGQYDAEALLAALPASCSAGAAACLAITDEDLFVPRLQYVFGLGHLHHRVALSSVHRLWEDRRDDAPRRVLVREVDVLRRALKVAAHEAGHAFTLAHCAHYRGCVMAGTNSLEESDAGSLMLCPLDHEKLRWNLQFDPERRFRELAVWAALHGLLPEARYWAAMAEETPPLAMGGGL
jgi:archaemetzincin